VDTDHIKAAIKVRASLCVCIPSGQSFGLLEVVSRGHPLFPLMNEHNFVTKYLYNIRLAVR
jgi:hypothetical protein